MNLFEREYKFLYKESKENISQYKRNKSYKKIITKYKEISKKEDIKKIDILYFLIRYEIFLLLIFPLYFSNFFNQYEIISELISLYPRILIVITYLYSMSNKMIWNIFFKSIIKIKPENLKNIIKIKPENILLLISFLIPIFIYIFKFSILFIKISLVSLFIINLFSIIIIRKKMNNEKEYDVRKNKIKKSLKKEISYLGLKKDDLKFILEKKRLKISIFFMVSLFSTSLFPIIDIIKGPNYLSEIIINNQKFIEYWFYLFLILLIIKAIYQICINIFDISEEERVELNDILLEIYDEIK